MAEPLPPLLLRPHYVPKPWGGRRLADELGRSDLPVGPIGESWEVFDLIDDGPAEDPAKGSPGPARAGPMGAGPDAAPRCSRIDGGVHDGRPLRDVLGVPFPLFVKVLDARENLSVQIHPDGQDGGPVKEEAWVALGDGGQVAIADAASPAPLASVRPGTWLEHLRSVALTAGSASAVPPTVIHIPAGTVHAILAGALLLEVQNPADVTWRLDDYGRPGLDGNLRTLHLSESAAQLARPTPVPADLAPVAGDGSQRLTGQRFSLTLQGRGELSDLPAGAVYFTQPGEVRTAGGHERAVPAHRTVVLPEAGAYATCAGWMIAFAS